MGELRANVHSSGHLEEFFKQGWDFESQHATIYPKKKKIINLSIASQKV
jgi:hypothetical protein